MIAVAGQLLPWLAVLFVPALILRRGPGWLPMVVGSAFLIGAVGVYLGLRILGIEPDVLIFILMPSSLASVWLIRRYGKLSHTALENPDRRSSKGVVWFWLLLALIVAHLFFSLFDLLQRPTFPWDAWTTWIYRAKAWFLADGMSDVVSQVDFWRKEAGEVYTIGAFYYPELVSVYQYWSALILGTWNEQLLGLTWWLLSFSIVLSLFGLGRRLGLPLLFSLLLCYFFISLPMIGIHTTLAGYGDLWMAGYVGVGFGLLLVGLINNSVRELTLGLLLCGISILVKKEGVVWFALALWVIWIHSSPRLWWSVAFAGVMTISALIWSIWNSAMGVAGLLKGQIVLPIAGAIQLQLNDVREPFIDNLFNMGNWGVFWYLLLMVPPMALMDYGKRETRIALSIICWPLSAILVLFVFSNQGDWAKDFTAINRLFIHFIPAWLLSMALIVNQRLDFVREIRKC